MPYPVAAARSRIFQAGSPFLISLIEYYKLNEASGVRAGSHAGLALTDNNTVGSVAGKIGTAAQFVAASSEYLSSSSAAFVIGDIDFSISCWVYLDSKGASRTLVSRDQVNGPGRNYNLLYSDGTDRFTFFAFTAAGGVAGVVAADALGSPSLNTWYNIIAWHSATDNLVGIRVNDASENTVATSSAMGSSGASDFALGNSSTGHHNGRMDEIMLASRLWTASEKTQIFNGSAGVTYPAFA